MRKMKHETKKNIVRGFVLILALIFLLGIFVIPLAGVASAEEADEGSVTVTSFETGKLSEAIDKAKDGVDLNNITHIAVSGGTMNAADYSAVCGYPNTEYIELAGADTEDGVIPDNAMPSRNQLVYISLPRNTVTIGARAFSGNRTLLKISMPSTVRHIGDYAFEGCERVEEFTVPAELETLGAGAFSDCKALASFAIPAALTEIPENCFSKASLTELHLGPQVTAVGNGAFSDCHSLADIYYYGDKPFSADQSAFQNLKVTIHVYSDLEGFDGLENNFVTVAYDMSEDSVYIPPVSADVPENTDGRETQTQTEASDASEGDDEAVSSEESTAEETAGTTQTAADNSSPAASGGFGTASVVIIAVLCVIIGVLAALLIVGRKKR